MHLPDNVDMSKVKFEAYTGLQGSTEKEYTASKNEYNNTVTFYTTSTLQLQEGLTIVVGFEKGLVHEPTIQEYISYWFEDNKEVLIGILGATITIVYCIISWYMVGRDPKKDIIIPRYSPPEGLSPSEVKYIDSMGKYDKVFESSILNLAVKGYIKIEKKEEKKFKKTGEVLTLIKQDKTPGNDLSEDEIDIYNSLPQETKLEYNILLHGKLTNMQNRQKKYLYKEMNGKMYSRNIGKISISIIMSIITIIFSLFMIGKFEAFSDIFVVGWMIIFTFIFAKMVIKKILSLDAIIFILPFFGVELVMLIVLAMNLGFGMMMLILLLAIINSVYAILIRAYTKEGR